MTTVVDFANVGRQLAKQGRILPHQERAFVVAGDVVRAGGDMRAFLTAFTKAWRESPVEQPAPVPPKEERQRIFNSFAGIPNLSQPDEVTCQAATCAMLAGKTAADIPVIRRTLQSFGDPGAPRVMARYLRSQLGERYILEEDATLRQAIEWLKAGEAIGTHGWHTRSGHVCLLDGVSFDQDGNATYISVKDPRGRLDPDRWRFVPNTRFYDGDISLLLAYALFVVNSGGMSGSRKAYQTGRVNLTQGGMICHRVLPPSVPTVPFSNAYQLTPRRRAILDVIAWAEGTDGAGWADGANGYRTMFTHKIFDGYADHPRQMQTSRKFRAVRSDAAGRYQFLSTTWDEVKRAINLPDFSPKSQDQAALWLIDAKRGVLDEIDRGDLKAALEKLSWEWASLPPGRYGQPQKKFSDLQKLFDQKVKEYS